MWVVFGVVMPSILVVVYGGGHVNMMLPVIKNLIDLGHKVSVLGLTTAGNVLRRHDIAYMGFEQLLDYCPDRQQALALGHELVPHAEPNSPVTYAESVAYHGLNMQELELEYGHDKARQLYQTAGRQAFLPVNLLQAFMQDLDPQVVVTTNSPRAEKAALIAAKNLGIASLAAVDMFAIRSYHWLVPYAQRICVLNDKVKDYLVDKGAQSNQVCVTGNPSFDAFVQQATNSKPQPQDKFTLLWASQFEPAYFAELDIEGNPNLPREIEAQLFNVMTAHPEWQLIARNHPNEPEIVYPKFVQVSPASEDLADLLHRVDVVITMTSTVGFQGLICGKPLVTIAGSVFESMAPFEEILPCTKVTDLSQLEVELHRLSLEGVYRQSVYSQDDAAGEITQQIVNMAVK